MIPTLCTRASEQHYRPAVSIGVRGPEMPLAVVVAAAAAAVADTHHRKVPCTAEMAADWLGHRHCTSPVVRQCCDLHAVHTLHYMTLLK